MEKYNNWIVSLVATRRLRRNMADKLNLSFSYSIYNALE